MSKDYYKRKEEADPIKAAYYMLHAREGCANCGVKETAARLVVHHVVPSGRNGINHPRNLVILCDRCHNNAHDDNLFYINDPRIKEVDRRISFLITERNGFREKCNIDGYSRVQTQICDLCAKRIDILEERQKKPPRSQQHDTEHGEQRQGIRGTS
jgi:hypothetical protein